MTQNLPAAATAPSRRNRLLMDPVTFDHVQRVAKVFAISPLFPEHLRKGSAETAIANAILVINMADRLNEDELTVAQAIYFVGGKPGWSSSYLIAKANQHGVFRDPIDWEIAGKGDALSVTAFAFLKSTGKRVSVTCDMKMARAEGWTKNPKYMSMPEQMLRYRSATFLIRLYCPEVMVGVPAAVEHELGMRDVSPGEPFFPTVAEDVAEVVEEAEVVPAASAKPAPAREAPKAEAKTPAAEEKPAAAAQAQPDVKAPEEAPDRDGMEQLVETIMADIAASGMIGATMDFYADQIARLGKHAPDLKAALDARVAALDSGDTGTLPGM